jgi:thymidylate kinase
MKKKIIVLEGCDGVGKSQLSRMLIDRFQSALTTSPSKTNCVSFLRDVTRKDMSLSAFSRQALHSITNVIDYVENLSRDQNIVMDRCHLSTLLYGLSSGADPDHMSILLEVHQKVAAKWSMFFDIDVFVLDRETRFGSADGSFHETLDWQDLRRSYLDFLKTDVKLFGEHERHHLLEVGDLNSQQLYYKVLEALGEGTP